MSGDPRYQIDVTEAVFQLAHAYARRAGFRTTSAWLRHLLLAWDGQPLERRLRRTKQLSVRLSPPLEACLAEIAADSQTAKSEAILVENALIEGSRSDAHSRAKSASPDIPERSDKDPA